MVAFSRPTKDGDFAMLRKSGGPFHRKLIVEVTNWNDGDAEDPVLYWDDTAASADVPEIQEMMRGGAGTDPRTYSDERVAVVYATDFRSGGTRALRSTDIFVPRAGGGFLARFRDGWATFDTNGAFLGSFGPSKQAWVHDSAAYGATDPDTLLVGTLAPPERRTSRRPFLMGPDHPWEISLANVRTGALVPLMTNVDHSNQVVWSPH